MAAIKLLSDSTVFQQAQSNDAQQLTALTTTVDSHISTLAGSTGASLVGVGTTSLSGTRSADFYFKQRGMLLTADSRVDSTGATDSAIGAQAVLTAAAGDSVHISKGVFKMVSSLTIPAGGLTLEGMGHDSQLMVGVNNQVLLNAISNGRVRLFNMALIGDKTASASNNGIGLKFGNITKLELDTIHFENFGFASIRGDASAAAQIVGSISNAGGTAAGNILIPTTITSGALAVGQIIWSSNGTPTSGALGGVNEDTRIVANNGDGTWTVSRSGQTPVGTVMWAIPVMRATMRNISCIGSTNPTGGENGDIYFNGPWRDVTIDNFVIDPDKTAPVGNGVVFAQSAAGQGWGRVQLRGGRIFGVAKRGLAFSAEVTNDGTAGRLIIDDCQIFNTGFEAIKTKNTRWVTLSNIYAEGCEPGVVEDAPNGLQGTIFINACEDFNGNNITVRNCGTDGIRFTGFDPSNVGGNTYNISRYRWNLNNYICDGAAQCGIYIPFASRDIQINNAIITDAAIGMRIQYAVGKQGADLIKVSSSTFRNCTGQGVFVQGVTGTTIGRLTFNGCTFTNNGGDGFSGTFIDYLKIHNCEFTDNARGASWASTTKYSFEGNRCSVVDTSVRTQAAPISANGGTIGMIVGNDFTDSGAAPIFAAPTNMVVSNNKGWLTASATVDPASLATGVSTSLSGATISVPGAALGDMAKWSFSQSLAGLTLTVFVSAANTVTYFFTNTNGANPTDLASGTLTVTVEKNS